MLSVTGSSDIVTHHSPVLGCFLHNGTKLARCTIVLSMQPIIEQFLSCTDVMGCSRQRGVGPKISVSDNANLGYTMNEVCYSH